MQLTAAVLCDFASVREGLLTVVSAPIKRMFRPAFPAPLACSLAMLLELHPTEFEHPHEVDVIVQGQDGERVAQIKAALNSIEAVLEPGETLVAPLVADLQTVGVGGPGAYSVEITIDGTHHRTLQFWVVSTPPILAL